jgi:glycerophosphoryl diester phosphodiesterase
LLIIGHRGSPLEAPENTISSFEEAFGSGADMVELDVHLCSSGELIVIHDETVDRTTNGTGDVSDLELIEIRELDAGPGEKLPTLEEVLARFSDRIGFNIELKGAGTAEGLWKLLNDGIGERTIGLDDMLISSFKPEELFDFRSRSREMKLGYIFEAHPHMGIEFAHEIGAWSIHPKHILVDEKMIEKARELGLKVIVWTVNDEVDMKWMIELGVDGIITDKPGLLAGLVKS